MGMEVDFCFVSFRRYAGLPSVHEAREVITHRSREKSHGGEKKRATKIYLHVYAIAHPWWPLSCAVQSQHCIRRDLDVFSSYHFQIVRHNSSNHPAAWLVNNDYPAGREREARVFMLITSKSIHTHTYKSSAVWPFSDWSETRTLSVLCN